MAKDKNKTQDLLTSPGNFNVNSSSDYGSHKPSENSRPNRVNETMDASALIEEDSQFRQPIVTSPKEQGYNRLKYYSALRTGY